MGENKIFGKLKYVILVLLFCPLMLLVGCQANCNNIVYDDRDYGSYNVSFYLNGELYKSVTSNDNGYVKPWPKVTVPDNHWFYGWSYNEDCLNGLDGLQFRAYKDTKLYGKFVENFKVTLINSVLEPDDDNATFTWRYARDCELYNEINEMERYYSFEVAGYSFEGLFLDKEYTKKLDENTILNDDFLNICEYNKDEQNINIYLKHEIINYSISYDLGTIYASRCDNSANPTSYNVENMGALKLEDPKTDGSIMFGGWQLVDHWNESWFESHKDRIYTSIPSTYPYYISLKFKAVWQHYKETNNNKNLEYGYYPQSLKAEDVKILDENKPETEGVFKGYYKADDGCYYAKITATLYNNAESITVKNGTLVNGNTYYFKVEPISWEYITNPGTAYEDDDDDTNGVVSEYILDNSTYNDIAIGDDSLIAKMLIKQACSEMKEKQFTAYNDTIVKTAYDECNPFAMIADEFGDIKKIPYRHNDVSPSTHTNFHSLMQRFNEYLDDKSNSNYYHFNNQAMDIFSEDCLLPYKVYSSQDKYSVLIDFKNKGYKYDSSLIYPSTLDDSIVLNSIAKLFGFESFSVFEERALSIAKECGYSEYKALENSFVRTYDNSFVFPFLINNNKTSMIYSYLIVGSDQNVYLWVNDLTYVLRAINYKNGYTSGVDLTNKIYCKDRLFVKGHTSSFTSNQLSYYIDGSLLSPTSSQIQSLSSYGRQKIATDYAIARGINTYTSDGLANWWLSSKPDSQSSYIQYIDNSGLTKGTISYMVPEEYCGFVPFLMFNKTP